MGCRSGEDFDLIGRGMARERIMKNPFYEKIKEDSDEEIGMDWDAEDSEADEERKKNVGGRNTDIITIMDSNESEDEAQQNEEGNERATIDGNNKEKDNNRYEKYPKRGECSMEKNMDKSPKEGDKNDEKEDDIKENSINEEDIRVC